MRELRSASIVGTGWDIPRRDSGCLDPAGDIHRVEAHEAPDLDVRDASLRDQPPHVPFRDTETLRNRSDVQQPRKLFHAFE